MVGISGLIQLLQLPAGEHGRFRKKVRTLRGGVFSAFGSSARSDFSEQFRQGIAPSHNSTYTKRRLLGTAKSPLIWLGDVLL